ncbi:L,D-transpeptidase family protein [Chitinimonas lacunae]|uniref:Murein L,D-transpeptidase family protein n=1 Tax=Chitinimonas lacunae TaxID=1963018 RepID=A0ABV8MSP2_9NEIS
MKRRYLLSAMFGLSIAALAAYFAFDFRPGTDRVEAEIDFILVEKSARRLTAYQNGVAVQQFRVALGREPVGPKRCEGDKRTPEGRFTIDSRLDLGQSSFHRALHISYPRRADIEAARSACPNGQAGGQIMIHGLGVELGRLSSTHHQVDWTLGCIALTNEEIDWLYRNTRNGTAIEIRP